MFDPISIAVATKAATVKAAAAFETTAVAPVAVGGTEVATGLEACREGGSSGALGVSTEAFVDTLKPGTQAVAEGMLERAPASGMELNNAMKGGTNLEFGQTNLSAGNERTGFGAQSFNANKWTDFKSSEGEFIEPKTIAERFRPLREIDNLTSFVKNLEQNNPGFRQEMDRRLKQFQEASTPAGRDAALQQARKTTSGKLGEVLVRDGFSPFFNGCELQKRIITPNGTTFVDLRFTEARGPLVFGRGYSVPEGGNLSVETKTGRPPYLAREVNHITERQVPGHLSVGDQSLTVTSRDVYSMSGERSARDAIHEAGSHVMALLPEKHVIDEAIFRVLKEHMTGV